MRASSSRFRIFGSIITVSVIALSCGDSDNTPLGSEFIGDLLGSEPGTVFQDTIRLAGGDTSYAFYSMIDRQNFVEVGQADGYVRTGLVRPDFSSAGNDTLKTVSRANLRLLKVELEKYTDGVTVRFYELGQEYNEGDSIQVLDTTLVIPDTTGALDRQLQLFPPNYPLPPDLVQGWIRGEAAANGIAIVYVESGDELFGFWSRTGELPPTVQVTFTDGTETSYPVVADGIYTRPAAETSNLVISDGFVRRIHLPVDISAVDDSAAVHEARLVLTYVPETVFGLSQSVLLYAPESPDPDSPEFLSGQAIVQETLDESAGTLELKITNALLRILAGELENNGFALRFLSENSEVRQAEFYSSADPQRRPTVYITYSTPADFEE